MSSSPDEIQDRFAQALKDYVEALNDGAAIPPFRKEHDVNSTEAALGASEILNAAEIDLFELQMWRGLGG